MFQNLFNSSYHNIFDYITLAVLAAHILLYIFFSSRELFLYLFIFWRLVYNVGLGILLHMQSRSQVLTKWLSDLCLIEKSKAIGSFRNRLIIWLKEELSLKMANNDNFETIPPEFNCWLLFRHAVDVILMSDVLSFVLLCTLSFKLPEVIMWQDLFFYTCGIALLAFNYWVKTQAHHTLTDYAWCKSHKVSKVK